jgi:hypothetical protein
MKKGLQHSKEILKNVLRYHPESRFNKKHLLWYKNKLRLNKFLPKPDFTKQSK